MIDIETKFEQKIAPLSGGDIHYFQAGTGPKIIFIHGITTYSFIWERVIESLPDFTCIAFDLPGTGKSHKNIEKAYSIKNHSETLNEFLQYLGEDSFHLVAHDIGGGILQRFAVLHGDRVKSITLINPVAFDYWPVQPIESLRTPIIRQFILATMDLGMFRVIVRRGMFDSSIVDDNLMKKFQAPMEDSAGRKAFLHFARSLDNNDLMEIADQLPKVNKPTVLIRGDGDVYLTENIILRLAECWPSAKLIRVKESGHYLPWESPEIVSNSVRELIENDK